MSNIENENSNYYVSEWFYEDDALPPDVLDDLENGTMCEIDNNQELIDFYNNLFLLEEYIKNDAFQSRPQ